MDFFIYLFIVLVIVWVYVLFFKKEPKENLDIDYSKKDEVKKPLSRETLKNINQNREVKSNYEDNIQKDNLLFVRVTGVTNKNYDNKNRQEILKDCIEGEELKLIKELDNKFSRYAIKVCRLNGEQLGYLEDKLSQKIHSRDMSTATVYINEIIGGTGDKVNIGCIIEIQFS